MTERNRVKYSNSISDFMNSIDEKPLAMVVDHFEKLIEKHGATAKLSLYVSDYQLDADINVDRLETDEEYEARMAEEREKAAKREAEERRQLHELLSKYPDEANKSGPNNH